MDGIARWELRIEGRVQGVNYRWSARKKAEELGLSGWVRNEADGSVLCQVSGPEEVVSAFVRWCEQGPAAARVRRVLRRPAEGGSWKSAENSSGEGDGFDILG